MRTYAGMSPQQRATARRNRLISAATELFATRGYTSTSVQRICLHAQVSTRDFYVEFKNKEALLIEVYAIACDRHQSAIQEAFSRVPPDADVLTLLTEVAYGMAACLEDDPHTAQILFVTSFGVSTAVEKRRDEIREQRIDQVEKVIEPLVLKGEIPDEDHRAVAIAFVASFEHLKRNWARTGGPIEGFAERTIRVLSRLLVSRTESI